MNITETFRRQRKRRGTILIVVLVIVVLISLAAYNFTMSMQAEYIATRYGGDRAATQQAALSAKEIVSAIIEQPRELRSALGAVANQSIPLWPTESEQESIASAMIQFSPTPTTLGETSELVATESSKINLHQLLLWDQSNPGYAQQVLMQLPGMTKTLLTGFWIGSTVIRKNALNRES